METLKRSQQFIEGARWATKRAVAFMHSHALGLFDVHARGIMNGAAREFGVINKKAYWLDAIHDNDQEGPWRCFHCGEVMTTHEQARSHFGSGIDSITACQITIDAYREMECDLNSYRSDTDAVTVEFYRLGSEHNTKVRRAEEEGYAKGLRDARGGVYPGEHTLMFNYVNHRSLESTRRVCKPGLWFGVTEWHPIPQWFLGAFDLDRGEQRDFAVLDISYMCEGAPNEAGS